MWNEKSKKCTCRHNKSSSVWNLKPVLKSDLRLSTVWDLDTDLRCLTGSWIFLYEWVVMKNNTVLFFIFSILSNCFLRKAIENNLNREWPIEFLFGKKNKSTHIFEKKIQFRICRKWHHIIMSPVAVWFATLAVLFIWWQNIYEKYSRKISY